MNIIYLIPFSYFFSTRLRKGSIAFHVVFEWIAAILLVSLLGTHSFPHSILFAILSYFAFISLYEIGYLANDLFFARKESNGRRRGPQSVGKKWIFLWVTTRIISFLVITITGSLSTKVEWWLFFTSLIATFTLHNYLIDREIKTITFIWLAWFRFMAPLIFVVQEKYIMGIAFAASITYVIFRLLGYIDSKNLLRMPSRKKESFRLIYFIIPLISLLVTLQYDNSLGFLILISYYAIAALIGSFLRKI